MNIIEVAREAVNKSLPLSHEDSLKVIAEIAVRVVRLEDLILSKQETIAEPDVYFDVEKLSHYIPDHPARSTIYTWTSDKLIPFYKKGRKVFFLKAEIDAWLKSGRRQTVAEIGIEADKRLKNK